MDPIRVGSDIRLLRRRRGWSQRRLATEARVSRWVVATLESGRAGTVRINDAIAVAAALDAYLSIRVLFHGEALDRLRDRGHAGLVDRLVALLRSLEWEVATEVSFNHFGERGSIDILAFHPASRSLLVIEVKTVVPELGGMLTVLDRKVRLAPEIARERGWTAMSVSRVVVLLEETTTRRRVAQHAATFLNAFPERTVGVRSWLRAPMGTISGRVFLSSARGDGERRESRPASTRPTPPVRTSGWRKTVIGPLLRADDHVSIVDGRQDEPMTKTDAWGRPHEVWRSPLSVGDRPKRDKRSSRGASVRDLLTSARVRSVWQKSRSGGPPDGRGRAAARLAEARPP